MKWTVHAYCQGRYTLAPICRQSWTCSIRSTLSKAGDFCRLNVAQMSNVLSTLSLECTGPKWHGRLLTKLTVSNSTLSPVCTGPNATSGEAQKLQIITRHKQNITVKADNTVTRPASKLTTRHTDQYFERQEYAGLWPGNREELVTGTQVRRVHFIQHTRGLIIDGRVCALCADRRLDGGCLTDNRPVCRSTKNIACTTVTSTDRVSQCPNLLTYTVSQKTSPFSFLE